RHRRDPPRTRGCRAGGGARHPDARRRPLLPEPLRDRQHLRSEQCDPALVARLPPTPFLTASGDLDATAGSDYEIARERTSCAGPLADRATTSRIAAERACAPARVSASAAC